MILFGKTRHPSQEFLSSLARCKLDACNDEGDLGVPSIYRELLFHARSLAYSDIPDYDRFKRAFGQLAGFEETRESSTM